jgi:hypothetical protein
MVVPASPTIAAAKAAVVETAAAVMEVVVGKH